MGAEEESNKGEVEENRADANEAEAAGAGWGNLNAACAADSDDRSELATSSERGPDDQLG